MPDSLERELQRQLAPVRAPDSLWDMRLSAASHAGRLSSAPVAWNPGRKLIFSPVLAMILLIVAAGAVWKTGQIRNAAPVKLSPNHTVVMPVAGTTGIQSFSESCLMCHTVATLYVSPQ
jgi:hypothetical protein